MTEPEPSAPRLRELIGGESSVKFYQCECGASIRVFLPRGEFADAESLLLNMEGRHDAVPDRRALAPICHLHVKAAMKHYADHLQVELLTQEDPA